MFNITKHICIGKEILLVSADESQQTQRCIVKVICVQHWQQGLRVIGCCHFLAQSSAWSVPVVRPYDVSVARAGATHFQTLFGTVKCRYKYRLYAIIHGNVRKRTAALITFLCVAY